MVNIGDLRYADERSFTVELTNSGPVEGLFHFIPPPSLDYEGDYMDSGLPAWLKAWPDEGVVPAGKVGQLGQYNGPVYVGGFDTIPCQIGIVASKSSVQAISLTY